MCLKISLCKILLNSKISWMGWAGIGGNGMARVGLNCLLSTQNAKEQDEFSCFFFFLLLMGFFKKIFWLFFFKHL